MKLLLDNGLPRSTVGLLIESCDQALHVASVGMASSDDLDIMDFARDQHWVIVTLDSDFHTHLALSGLDKPSVIRLRIEGLKAKQLAELVISIVRRFQDELNEGAAISVGHREVRCHLLPIRRKTS